MTGHRFVRLSLILLFSPAAALLLSQFAAHVRGGRTAGMSQHMEGRPRSLLADHHRIHHLDDRNANSASRASRPRRRDGLIPQAKRPGLRQLPAARSQPGSTHNILVLHVSADRGRKRSSRAYRRDCARRLRGVWRSWRSRERPMPGTSGVQGMVTSGGRHVVTRVLCGVGCVGGVVPSAQVRHVARALSVAVRAAGRPGASGHGHIADSVVAANITRSRLRRSEGI